MQERILRITPDNFQRLDCTEGKEGLKQTHFFQEISRIEISNIEKEKFVIWYDILYNILYNIVLR
jgi:hypothetical protein